MKNLLRVALVILMLVGLYAGVATPAPAMAQTASAITVSEGGEPMPTCYPTPTNPCKPPLSPKDQ